MKRKSTLRKSSHKAFRFKIGDYADWCSIRCQILKRIAVESQSGWSYSYVIRQDYGAHELRTVGEVELSPPKMPKPIED